MKKVSKSILVAMMMAASVSGKAQKVYENRNEIDPKYKWNLSELFQNWNEWEAALKQCEVKMDEIAKMKGQIKESPDNLLKVEKLSDELSILFTKVYQYPNFMSDLDGKNQDVKAKVQRVSAIYSKFETATSWISPEMLSIPFETMQKWLADEKFKPYKFNIENLYRKQKHILSEDKEKMLSFYSQFESSPSSIYDELSTSDINFPTITLSTGEKAKSSYGNYFKIMAESKNQADRKMMFEAHYNTYISNKNTYAAIYNASCNADWAKAQTRNYSSCLEAKLNQNNIPVEVYENLIKTVRQNTAPLQRYHNLRKNLLKLDKYYSYDQYIPLTDFESSYTFEQATEMVQKSVSILGESYSNNVKKLLSNNSIDVFECEGKRSGAYSAGIYGVHPFILLNYNSTLDAVFTMAHEMGHSMHTELANANQPYATSDYSIFVAEVASTFGEAVMLDHMLKITKDPKAKIFLLQQSINGLVSTFYTQTLFADFEYQAHQLAEKGEPITSEVLSNIVDKLNDTYYGGCMEKNDLAGYIWTRISHFYNSPFYVYQYATSFAASSKIYEDYKKADGKEKQKVIDNYLTLLKSGGNDYPFEQMKKAGIDLSKPESIKAVADRLDYLVGLLETEMKNLNKK